MSRPIFETEVKFFDLLGISYRYGRRLVLDGVLVPDAETSSGAHLFLTDLESLEGHRGCLRRYNEKLFNRRFQIKEIAA